MVRPNFALYLLIYLCLKIVVVPFLSLDLKKLKKCLPNLFILL